MNVTNQFLPTWTAVELQTAVHVERTTQRHDPILLYTGYSVQPNPGRLHVGYQDKYHKIKKSSNKIAKNLQRIRLIEH